MHVRNLKSKRSAAGGSRVEADVDGEALWFESNDVSLCPSGEAYLSSLLLPAAAKGTPLHIEAPVDQALLGKVDAILRLANEWWKLHTIAVLAPSSAIASAPGSPRSAQCFTGGVDSFHSLVSARNPPDLLLFAHGFDIDLADCRRLNDFLPGLRETAAAYGSQAVVIRTNLRQHHAMRWVTWEKSHGGALACLGHLLTGSIGRLIIPSTFNYPMPWGSHWELDHLWSASQLLIEHSDPSLGRVAKVRALAEHSVAMRHLRVCWENNVPAGNCSRCEKCIRTMLALSSCDRLEAGHTFDLSVPLDARLDALSVVPAHLLPIYEGLRRDLRDPRVQAALDRLIARSRGIQGRLRNLIQKVRRGLDARLRRAPNWLPRHS